MTDEEDSARVWHLVNQLHRLFDGEKAGVALVALTHAASILTQSLGQPLHALEFGLRESWAEVSARVELGRKIEEQRGKPS